MKCTKHIRASQYQKQTRIRRIAGISLLAAILNDVTRLQETAISDGTAVN